MPSTSVGGLVSGLDTATIISQLMQLEARPQTLLRSKVSTAEKVVTALQGLNAKLAAMTTKAAELAKSDAWTPTKATSSNDKVRVTADAGASPVSVTFDVARTARAYTAAYATPMAASSEATPGSSLTVSYADGRPDALISLTDRTLEGVAEAINSSAAGLRATLVRAGGTDDAPTYQLQVASSTTGAGTRFTIQDVTGSFLGGVSGEVLGSDAELTIGGVTRTYSSNTVTDLVPGVDVTLLAGSESTTATITVERDVASLSDSVKAMVDSVNAALDDIGKLTAYDAASKKAGLLAGDGAVRGVRNQLLESVTRTASGSLATVGVQVDRYGRLTFDEARFNAAYAADPTGTSEKLSGLADVLADLGDSFSHSFTGTLTLGIKSRQSAIKGLEDDIADWDVRLAARQTTLQRQYTALESALGKLQSQSSWLAGQIASLPTMSSGQ